MRYVESGDAHFTAFNTHTSTRGDILNHSAFNFAMAPKARPNARLVCNCVSPNTRVA